MGPLNGHLNAKRVGFIFIETWVGACIRQLQTTTSNARVSSPSKVFADEVKRSRGGKKRSYFGNISFRILPCWLSLSPLFNDMLQNFVSWMPWEEEGGEIRRRGKKKNLSNPLFKDFLLQTKKELTGQALPAWLPPSHKLLLPPRRRRRPGGWKQQCADVLSLRALGFGKLMRKRGDYGPFVNGATSVFRFLVWNDTLW